MSGAVCAVRNQLLASAAGTWEHAPPVPHDDARLLQLIQRQK